jgi:hypothetical protein
MSPPAHIRGAIWSVSSSLSNRAAAAGSGSPW